MNIVWPKEYRAISTAKQETIRERLQPGFSHLLNKLQLPHELNTQLAELYLPLSAWLFKQCRKDKPLIVGINGSQGSGKSTLCQLLKFLLEAEFNLKTCVLSIDDLYLTHAERQQLAQDVHPLLLTRGAPGTHDISLGLQVFKQLSAATEKSSTLIPRFNKACDDRADKEDWEKFYGRPDLILFEGWCVGAVSQQEAELEVPINSLEEKEDLSAHWRRHVNQQLKGPYQQLFERLDLLLMLKAPDWAMVYQWRHKQEQQLITSNPSGTMTMDDDALLRFIMHYERLTRHQLEEMPERADLVLLLKSDQRIEEIILKGAEKNYSGVV